MVPIRLSATIADDLWLIGLYTAEGDNFYAVAGADLKKRDVQFVIVAPDQTVEEAGVDFPETSEEILVVNSPVTEGIAMIRAPLKGPSRSGARRRGPKGYVVRSLYEGRLEEESATSCGRVGRVFATEPLSASAYRSRPCGRSVLRGR